MKKGKVINLLAGLFDVILGLGLIAIVVLSVLEMFGIIPWAIYFGFLMEPLIFLWILIFNSLPASPEILIFGYLGVVALFGLLTLIFGSVTLARVRKDQTRYYRKGCRLIGYAVVETIILLFFAAHMIPYIMLGVPFMVLLPLLILNAVIFKIVVARYIGMGMLYCGRKKYLAETPIGK